MRRLCLTLMAAVCFSSNAVRADRPDVEPVGLNRYLRTLYPDLGDKAKYRTAEADLNGDGIREIFVYVTDPQFCGTSGCTLLVLQRRQRTYRKLIRANARLPLRLLSTRTHGWRDLAVRVAGGGVMAGYDAALRFDGRRYPQNPTVPPAAPLKGPRGVILMRDEPRR